MDIFWKALTLAIYAAVMLGFYLAVSVGVNSLPKDVQLILLGAVFPVAVIFLILGRRKGPPASRD